ncbi:dipeptidase [Congregibacter litoralis]|uniref:Zn-dependent dipeptidase, microsomal dipeptidase-like protein n=1 Tax=Congregibacter litoralis KT71 TaxID=314285 RepID=A4AAT8_9GAMM|nr:membrane dipeptidase [Congregibacter litoralis]EAQ96810.1 Zn-dependent dipeptidase, microsomal dipeptidase-like protein [Congregibacter litoralis KT71]
MKWDTNRRTFIQGAAAVLASQALPGAADSGPDKSYEDMLVIDALCFGKEWGEEVFAALRAANYSGIIESLPRKNLQTAIDALLDWRKRIENHSDQLMFALQAEDFRRAKDSKRTAVMMNFQNSTMLNGDVDNIDALYALGMRSFQLTYNFRNLVGDGCLERTNAGLSDFGLEVVERMNDTGVLIDLSHCGDQTTLDGIAFSQRPVGITHTMCDALRSHPRAKTDEQMRNCAEKGGVIGMVALGYFVGPDPGGDTTIEHYADHIEHAVNVAGIEHIGISTDYPPQGISPWATYEEWFVPRTGYFKPSYELRWPPWIPALDTTDRYRNLMAVLEGRGCASKDIERLLGLNWLRLLGDTIG